MNEQFEYDDFHDPPRPIVLLDLADIDGKHREFAQLALLDTGADCSLLPGTLSRKLNLQNQSTNFLQIGTVAADPFNLPMALVVVRIGAMNEVTLEMAVHPDLPYLILGRDFLNQYRILFDGPDLKVTIS